MRRPITAALALLAAAPLAACDMFCEDADLSCGGPAERADPECSTATGHSCNGADYSRGLFLELPALADGTYAIEGSADGEPFSCTVTVADGQSSVGCPGLPSPWWDSPSAIEFNSVPCEVTVELRAGEQVLSTQTVRPHYHWSEPWGEGCDWAGEATVQLDPPGSRSR